MRFTTFVIPGVFFVSTTMGTTSNDLSSPLVTLSTDLRNPLSADADVSTIKGDDEYIPFSMSLVEQNEPGKFPLYSSNALDKEIVGFFTLMVHTHWINNLALSSLETAAIDPNSERGRAAKDIAKFFGSMWNPDSTGPEDLSGLIQNIIGYRIPDVRTHYATTVRLTSVSRSVQGMMEFMNWVFTEDRYSEDIMVFVRIADAVRSLSLFSGIPSNPHVFIFHGYLTSFRPKESGLPPREIATDLGKTYVLAGMILTRNGDSDIYYIDYPYDGKSGVYNLTPVGDLVVETGSDVTIENRFSPFVDTNQPVYKSASYVLMYVEKPITIGNEHSL